MTWMRQDSETHEVSGVDREKEAIYEKAKAEGLPIVTKESESGVKPFETMKFQPVRSPGIYEAEFGVKGKDLIFHFWPDGYHKAERDEKRVPEFKKNFFSMLSKAMGGIFGTNRILIKDDGDVGAFFVQAHGWGESDNHRELAIKACEEFHKDMGGVPG